MFVTRTLELDENEIFPCEKVQVSPRCRIDSTSRGEEMKQEAASLIAMCYINLSACIVNGPVRKRDDYMRAVYYCDKVRVSSHMIMLHKFFSNLGVRVW